MHDNFFFGDDLWKKTLSNNINVYIHDSENESVPTYKTRRFY